MTLFLFEIINFSLPLSPHPNSLILYYKTNSSEIAKCRCFLSWPENGGAENYPIFSFLGVSLSHLFTKYLCKETLKLVTLLNVPVITCILFFEKLIRSFMNGPRPPPTLPLPVSTDVSSMLPKAQSSKL
jgi:hypothetical protein